MGKPPNPSHDVSAWKQIVVGTDEFTAVRRSRRRLWIAAVVIAAIGAAVVVVLLRR